MEKRFFPHASTMQCAEHTSRAIAQRSSGSVIASHSAKVSDLSGLRHGHIQAHHVSELPSGRPAAELPDIGRTRQPRRDSVRDVIGAIGAIGHSLKSKTRRLERRLSGSPVHTAAEKFHAELEATSSAAIRPLELEDTSNTPIAAGHGVWLTDPIAPRTETHDTTRTFPSCQVEDVQGQSTPISHRNDGHAMSVAIEPDPGLTFSRQTTFETNDSVRTEPNTPVPVPFGNPAHSQVVDKVPDAVVSPLSPLPHSSIHMRPNLDDNLLTELDESPNTISPCDMGFGDMGSFLSPDGADCFGSPSPDDFAAGPSHDSEGFFSQRWDPEKEMEFIFSAQSAQTQPSFFDQAFSPDARGATGTHATPGQGTWGKVHGLRRLPQLKVALQKRVEGRAKIRKVGPHNTARQHGTGRVPGGAGSLSCTMCGKKFQDTKGARGRVKRHEMSSCKERPQDVREAARKKCPHCLNTFARPDALREHQRSLHGDRVILPKRSYCHHTASPSSSCSVDELSV